MSGFTGLKGATLQHNRPTSLTQIDYT